MKAIRSRRLYCLNALVGLCLAACAGNSGEIPAIPPSTSTQTDSPPPTLPQSPTSFPTGTATAPNLPTPEIFDPGPFKYVQEVSYLLADPRGPVQFFAPADGSLWFYACGMYGGCSLARWQDGRGQVILAASEPFFQATVDPGGRAWVLRQDASAIESWKGGAWRKYGAEQGWLALAESESGGWAPGPWEASLARETLWLPTRLDVRAFDGTRWRAYSLEEMGFPTPEWEEMGITHRIAVLAGSEQVWVGECYYSGPGPMGGQGVRWFDGETWHGEDIPIGSTCVSAMQVDPGGRLWLGAKDAVWVFDPAGGTWEEYRLPQELLQGQNFSHPRDLLIDADGDIWAILQMCGGASCDGPSNLYRIHQGDWSLVAQSEWWYEPFKGLVRDSSGRGWLFWEGGVYRLAGADLLQVARLEARAVAVDLAGGLWVLAGRFEQGALWHLDPQPAE
jgi:hypothetical protein